MDFDSAYGSNFYFLLSFESKGNGGLQLLDFMVLDRQVVVRHVANQFIDSGEGL